MKREMLSLTRTHAGQTFLLLAYYNQAGYASWMSTVFEFVFQINHILSQRIMTALEEITPRVEQ